MKRKRPNLERKMRGEGSVVYSPPPNVDTRPDANFTGTLEEWDDRVFLNAVEFRVHRYAEGVHDTVEYADFAHAMIAAVACKGMGMRVIVYAMTETGRYQALQPNRWDHYAALYLARKDKANAQ